VVDQSHDGWRRVSRRDPCPVCLAAGRPQGAHKGCLIAADGDMVCLHVESAEPATFGLGGWWHRAHPAHRAAPLPPPRAPLPAPAARPHNPADRATCDRINRRLLELAALSFEDRAYVAGLHAPAHADLGALYGTLPRGDAQRTLIAGLVAEFGHDLLCSVPGFVIRNGHLRLNGAGLLVAISNVDGHLVGFQVRYGPGDYRWLSSGAGPSTGAPYHVARPRERRDQRIYVVESPKTANVLADRLGAVVIATAGHGNWKVAREPLGHLIAREGAEVVVIAFDADDPDARATTVAQVEHSRQQLAAAARDMSFHVKLARWAHADGKGPDDLLLAGHTWDLTVYRSAPDARPLEGDGGPGVAPDSGQGDTVRVQREALQRAYAKIDDLTQAYDALYRLALTEQYTESEKKMFLWTLHDKHKYCFGLPIPESFPTVYIEQDEMPRAGLSTNSFRTARQRLVKDEVFIETERAPGENSKSGRPYKVITVNGERLARLIVDLDDDPDARTKERLARAAARSEEARARYEKAQDTRARREEQERATRQQLATIGSERRRFAETTERLAHQLTEKEVEAEAMRRAAAAAQQEVQRIITQARRDSIPCGGCGTLIRIEDYRCDDCRAAGTEADRFARGGLDTTFGCNCHVEDVSTSPCVPTTNPMHPKVGDKSPADVPGEDLRVCAGGCGALTPHGWTCKPCRERPPGPLHIPDSTAGRREVSHGQ